MKWWHKWILRHKIKTTEIFRNVKDKYHLHDTRAVTFSCSCGKKWNYVNIYDIK